jgi:hypothetical protein
MNPLGEQLRIRPDGDVLCVWHGRSAKTVDEARGVLDAIDRALHMYALDLLLFDSRDADETPQEVQAVIWEWLQRAKLKRMATLIRSDMKAVSLRMAALGKRLKIGTFADRDAALAWLRGG